MAEQERKRKRDTAVADKPNKRRPVDNSDSIKTVSVEDGNDRLLPAIAFTSGLKLADSFFDAFKRTERKNNNKATTTSESLLLHSSDHATLDRIAHPEIDQTVSNYLGVYDPVENNLRLIPAYSVTVRATLRSETAEVQDENDKRTKAMQREALGMEFGTKKAKKAIASKTINAITAPSGSGVEAAVLDEVEKTSTALPVKDERDDAILQSKPIPRPNLTTDKAEEVYSYDVLIPVADSRAQTVKEWQDEVKAGREVSLSSRFVANRLVNVVEKANIQTLKALKYLLLLTEFYGTLQPKKGGLRLPKKDELKDKLSNWSDSAIDSVRRRFADGSELNKWQHDNLLTHMAAISLYIDGYKTDTFDLQEDLKLKSKQMSQFFHELGCQIRSPTEKEWPEFRIPNKAQAAQRKIAVLRIPLDFPKTRNLPRRR